MSAYSSSNAINKKRDKHRFVPFLLCMLVERFREPKLTNASTQWVSNVEPIAPKNSHQWAADHR